MSSCTLILLPGLGADSRMFHPQQAAFPDAIMPAWIEPRRGETLREYAARFADSLRPRLGGPAVLAGVSMGGMVALEMARHLPALRVVLIASCRSPRAVSRLLVLSEALTRPLPSWPLDKGRVLAPLFLGAGGTVPREDRGLLVEMARELPVSFLRWAARAVLSWPGCNDPGVPVHHIHGNRDPVILLKRVKPDEVVDGGSHVLNLSHPREVNAFLSRCLESAALGNRGSGGQ